MESVLTHVSWALGIDAEELSAWQMGLRAMVVYVVGVDSLEKVQTARIERSGNINAILRKD